jgi:predicted SAM-dependent methyltransferase
LTGQNEYGVVTKYGDEAELALVIRNLLTDKKAAEQLHHAGLKQAALYDILLAGEQIVKGYSSLKPKMLDLGCGTKKVADAMGMDNAKLDGVDLVHDLLDFPYPLKSESFDHIYMRHVAEHFSLENIQKIFMECKRLLKNRGCLHIHVPHAFSIAAFTDITHKSFFVFRSGDFWDRNNPKNYYQETESMWQLTSTRCFIVWHDWKKYRLRKVDEWMSGYLTRQVNKALNNKDNPSRADRIIKRYALQFVEIQWVFQKTD